MTVPDAMRINSPEQPSDPWKHDHCFGQDQKKPGEARTLVVIALTAGMMVIEMAAGWTFGSMALLADGLHMASHAADLSISAFAYYFARKRAHDRCLRALGGAEPACLLRAGPRRQYRRPALARRALAHVARHVPQLELP